MRAIWESSLLRKIDTVSRTGEEAYESCGMNGDVIIGTRRSDLLVGLDRPPNSPMNYADNVHHEVAAHRPPLKRSPEQAPAVLCITSFTPISSTCYGLGAGFVMSSVVLSIYKCEQCRGTISDRHVQW